MSLTNCLTLGRNVTPLAKVSGGRLASVRFAIPVNRDDFPFR